MLRVRIARKSDIKDIFKWRNHETTIKMSHSTELVDWQRHCKWFESTLVNQNKCVLICTTLDGGTKVAVVRFEVSDDIATISLNLSPSMRGRGLAKDCIRDSTAYLNSVHNEVSLVKAEIKSMNVASRKAFEGAGFTFCSELNDILYYEFLLLKPDI